MPATTAALSPMFAAERLARVFGTEEDPVNCSWFFKVGACRKGETCLKKHNQPTSSETLLLSGMYEGTPEGIAISNEHPWTDEMYDKAQAHVENFYQDVFLTVAQYGEVEEVVILDNTTPNLMGNVYVKFYREESAARALRGLTGRFYNGRLISAEFTPVADFREARCRTHHEKRCHLVGLCGFMHMKHIPRALKRRVVRQMYENHPEYMKRRNREMDVKNHDGGHYKVWSGRADQPGPLRRRDAGPQESLRDLAMADLQGGRGRRSRRDDIDPGIDRIVQPRRRRRQVNPDMEQSQATVDGYEDLENMAPVLEDGYEDLEEMQEPLEPGERPRLPRRRRPKPQLDDFDGDEEYDPSFFEDERPRRAPRRQPVPRVSAISAPIHDDIGMMPVQKKKRRKNASDEEEL